MSETQTPYTEDFYARQREGSLVSARIVLAETFALLGKPATLVDVGCGVGTWLRAAAEQGVEDTLGLDGPWTTEAGLEIPPERFRAVDLTEGPGLVPALPRQRFDLCMSLEVAEHLPAKAEGNFIALLAALSDAVLFSAAIPNQGGTDHVNEAWPEHWAGLFKAQGFHCYDVLRPRIWKRDEIEWWYVQNVLLFAKDGSQAAEKLGTIAAPADPPLPLVHPRKFELHAGHWPVLDRDRRIAALEQELAEARAVAAKEAARAEAAQRECARLMNNLATAQAVARYRANEASALRASTSWRATAPLRLAVRLLRARH